jgi:hypothetical protein
MITAIDDQAVVQEAVVREAVVNEEIWRAWVGKGRLQERAAARTFKLAAGFVVGLLAVGIVIYWVR